MAVPEILVNPSGERLVLRFPYNEQVVSVMRTLPEARWVSQHKQWTCLLTPSAAHRAVELLNTIGEPAVVPEAAAAADQWRRAVSVLQPEAPDRPIPVIPPDTPNRWGHQRRCFWFDHDRYSTMIAAGMGSGKSCITLDIANNYGPRRMLVVCPKSVIPVWPANAELFLNNQIPFVPLVKGNSAKKAALAMQLHESTRGPLAFVVNYESVHRGELAKAFLKIAPELVVLDESHRIKLHSGIASKYCFQLGRLAKKRLCLTGTPYPHSPLDIYAQYRFLDPGIFGTSFPRFRDRYAITSQVFPGQVVQWINQDELARKVGDLMFHVETRDVLDLPDELHQEIPITLSPRAQDFYNRLNAEMCAELEGGVLIAANALVKLLRLQQITGGGVAMEVHGEPQIVEVDTAKRDALSDIVSDIGDGEAIPVFCRFRHDLKQVAAVAESLGLMYGELSGERNDMDGNKLPPLEGPWERGYLFGVQIQSGSEGVDFTRAKYGVFYSLGYSLGQFLQAVARVVRPGQNHKVMFYHLVADGTVDRMVYTALQQRRDVVDFVLNSMKGRP